MRNHTLIYKGLETLIHTSNQPSELLRLSEDLTNLAALARNRAAFVAVQNEEVRDIPFIAGATNA